MPNNRISSDHKILQDVVLNASADGDCYDPTWESVNAVRHTVPIRSWRVASLGGAAGMTPEAFVVGVDGRAIPPSQFTLETQQLPGLAFNVSSTPSYQPQGLMGMSAFSLYLSSV